MLSSLFWVTGLVLESVLLVRALLGNLLKYYSLFYLYLISVFLRSASLFAVYHLWPNFYSPAYWFTQFLNVLLGCTLVWEVYKVALAQYLGGPRMVRNELAFLFILAFTRIFVKAWNSPNWIPGKTTLETERDLRTVQIALLCRFVIIRLRLTCGAPSSSSRRWTRTRWPNSPWACATTASLACGGRGSRRGLSCWRRR